MTAMRDEDPAGEELDLERGAALLTELEERLAASNAATAQAVAIAGRLLGTSVSEQVEGLPLELTLALRSRMTGGDRRMILTAGEVLQDMPIVAELFGTGQLSWGQVRGIVAAVRRLSLAARAVVDQRIAAFVAEHGGIDALDPDQLQWAVERAADELKRASSTERREQRRRQANYLSVQPDFDGGIRGSFSFDAVTGAIVLNALDAAAGAPRPHPDEPDEAAQAGETAPPDRAAATAPDAPASGPAAGEPPTGEDPDAGEPAAPPHDASRGTEGAGKEGPGPATGRARQYAEGLARMAAEWLGGGPGRLARPLFLAHVDIGDVTPTAGATIELNVRGTVPSITQRVLEQLATDADLRTVVFDGGRPLAVSRKLTAADIPTDTRIAVLARDRGCRFPGSTDPVGHADVHHAVHREHGGDHHPENLLTLARRYHKLTHERGWQLVIDPATGMVTATRRDRSYRSLPRGTPLPPPSQHPPPATADPPDGLPF